MSADALLQALRQWETPIVARVEGGSRVAGFAHGRTGARTQAIIAALETKHRSLSLSTIYTIGHSTRSLDELVAALKAHGVARWLTSAPSPCRAACRISIASRWS